MPNLGEQRRLELPGGAKPKWARYRSPIPRTPRPHRQLPGAGAHPLGFGDDWFVFEMPRPTYPGPDRQLSLGPDQRLPGTETQVKTGNDRFMFGMPRLTYPGPGRQRPDTGTQPVRQASD